MAELKEEIINGEEVVAYYRGNILQAYMNKELYDHLKALGRSNRFIFNIPPDKKQGGDEDE